MTSQGTIVVLRGTVGATRWMFFTDDLDVTDHSILYQFTVQESDLIVTTGLLYPIRMRDGSTFDLLLWSFVPMQ